METASIVKVEPNNDVSKKVNAVVNITAVAPSKVLKT